MSARETAELRASPTEDLARELEQTHQRVFNLRFQAATRQLADVSQVRKAKRRLALIRTLLREREIIAEADRAAAGAGAETAETGSGG
ncbi:MAG: 50S ribosomal protein L29 [Dehalococcoidia bacterium]|nr:50S ribosomal protein L29 [Dehalococcoidia bacterium]